MIDQKISVLDHGFVRLVDYMGSDARVVEAARVSTASQKKEVRRLIRYLMRKRHTGPFEQCVVVLHCKAPIFVARQWLRTRMSSTNERSGRYSELPVECYIPEYERVRLQATDNKQGSGEAAPVEVALQFGQWCKDCEEGAAHDYNLQLSHGIAKELARINLPLSQYTEWYWKIDLHNLLHFLKLRLDSHAQYEIREYAKVIEKIVAELFPVTYEAWVDYQRDAVTLSKQQIKLLARATDLTHLEFARDYGENIDKKELEELIQTIEDQWDG